MMAASVGAMSQAMAQTTLPPVREGTIQATIVDENGAVVLDTVSVVATKTGQRIIDTLGSVSVVTLPTLERYQPGSVAEALQSVPGVAFQSNVDDPAQSINIRGLQDFGRVNVLIDGARQDFQISGHNANGSFYLDPIFIGQADVVRGPIANIYGSGAIGGVVSFTTRGIEDLLKPDERKGVEETISLGTNGAGFLTSTSAGTRLGTAADVYGQIVYRNKSDYEGGEGDTITDTGSEILGGLFKANYRPAEGHTINLSAMVQDFTFDNASSGGQVRFDNEVKTGIYTLGWRFQSPDNPLIDLHTKVYHTSTDFEQTVVSATPVYQSMLGYVPGRKITDDIGTTGFDVHNTSRFDTQALAHALTYGVDGVHDDVETTDDAGGFTTAFTPSGTRDLYGAFVQDEVRYGGWLRVLAGARFDSYRLEGNGFSSDGTHLSPKATVGVTPLPGIEIYGTYAEGYRAPTISETLISGIHPFPAFPILPNPNLKPEVGHTLEAGINLKYDDVLVAGDAIRGKIAIYRNEVDDFIEQAFVFDPASPIFVDVQYQNVANARLEGAEIEAAYDWGRGFVSVAASHVEGENLEYETSLLSVVPDRASASFGLRFLEERLTVGTRLTLVGDRTLTARDIDPTGSLSPATAAADAAEASTAGYGLVDVFASYNYTDDVRASIAIDNIFDRRYRQYLYTEDSPGLTAKFALTVKFASK
jgi:hemoglobin/transferrin/lactoferrin receptor protein